MESYHIIRNPKTEIGTRSEVLLLQMLILHCTVGWKND